MICTEYKVLDEFQINRSFEIELIRKHLSTTMYFTPAKIGKGWDWTVLGVTGRRPTREQAIETARDFVLSELTNRRRLR